MAGVGFLKDKSGFHWKKFTEALKFLIVLILGTADCQRITRIDECGLACSQKFLCKKKEYNDFFNQFCREGPASLPHSVLESMKMFTVMKCTDRRRCSLHLSVKGTVHLDESIRGMEICSFALDTSQTQCVSVRLSRPKSKKSEGQKVQVQFNCFEVSVAQHLYVTMKTIPNYCDVRLEQEYFVEDCRNEDIADNVPACIAGSLNYKLDRDEKAISVHVTDFLEDEDYHIRLCRKWFSCQDIGEHAMIKREDAVKSASLHYSELLPCLCIEGWSAYPDARRRQICPFKNDTEILWNGVVYNAITQSLTWQPACPVHATAHLCLKTESRDQCLHLPNSSRTAHRKVEYSQVDTHPNLCIKFTTPQGSWVRCPFAHGQFAGWRMNIAAVENQVQIIFSTLTKATFNVYLRNKTQSSGHQLLHKYASTYADATNPVKINLSRELCGLDLCIQGRRSDVQYSIPVEICGIPCTLLPKDRVDDDGDYLLKIMLVAVSLIFAIAVAMMGYIALQVHYRKQMENKYSLKTKVQLMSPVRASTSEQRLSILYAKEEDDF